MRRRAECGPVICLGAASRLSPALAVRKSVQEAGQNFPLLRNLLSHEKDWRPASDFSNVTTFDYHYLTYIQRPDLVAPAFAFFDACQERVALSEMRDRSTRRVLGDIETCVALLRSAGHEVIVADVTTPEIADVGFSVVRVVVPGLVPLHGNHRRPFLGVRRLAAPPSGLNPYPHPFP
jgi:ribosomal protein S12 methylthiotransferase accessory factor